MFVRSEAIGLPAGLNTSTNTPPPSATSPAGSLMVHAAGSSNVSVPSDVVKLFQPAEDVAVALGEAVTEGDAVSVAGLVPVAVPVAVPAAVPVAVVVAVPVPLA